METEIDQKLNKIAPARRIAILSILIAMSLITFMLENLLPPLFIPGAKIGLSNIFSLLALFMFSPKDAILMVVIRTILSSLICGSMSMLIYSLTAGVISIVIAALLATYLFPKISLICISITSAVIHNIVQTLIFCLVIQNIHFIAYMPYLSIIGVLSGFIVGVVAQLIINKMPEALFCKLLKINNASN